jgi:hypothetical protein
MIIPSDEQQAVAVARLSKLLDIPVEAACWLYFSIQLRLFLYTFFR